MSVADTTIVKDDSKTRKRLLEAINRNVHAATKFEASGTLSGNLLHTAGKRNSTEQRTRRIDSEVYQTTPKRMQRRKGLGATSCCKRSAAGSGQVSESLGLHALDGPNLAFWAGVGIAILFQISVALVLA